MAKQTLREKQREIEDEHFAEVEKDMVERHDQQFVNYAHDVRGALRAVGAIAETLTSQHIRGLMMIEKEKLWRGLGYASFADFLTNDAAVKTSKTGYYDQRDILLNSSDEVLNAITGKLSARKVKVLLASGVEMSVNDGQLRIGEQSVEVGDTRAMATIVEGIHQTLVERDDRERKLTKQLDKEKEMNRIGEEELKRLRRELDSLEETRFKRAIMTLVGSFLTLTEAAGELDDAERIARGKEDLRLIAGLYFRLADSYGVKVPLSTNTTIDGLIDQAIADIDIEGLD